MIGTYFTTTRKNIQMLFIITIYFKSLLCKIKMLNCQNTKEYKTCYLMRISEREKIPSEFVTQYLVGFPRKIHPQFNSKYRQHK